MAIRFRCAYCNQLMGIGRRKSGTVVRCPKCSGQVVVPATSEVAKVAAPPSPAPTSPASPRRAPASPFEFEQVHGMLRVPGLEPPAPPTTPVVPPAGDTAFGPAEDDESFDVVPIGEPGQIHGIFLSGKQLLIAALMVAIALVAAFFVGWLVGRP